MPVDCRLARPSSSFHMSINQIRENALCCWPTNCVEWSMDNVCLHISDIFSRHKQMPRHQPQVYRIYFAIVMSWKRWLRIRNLANTRRQLLARVLMLPMVARARRWWWQSVDRIISVASLFVSLLGFAQLSCLFWTGSNVSEWLGWKCELILARTMNHIAKQQKPSWWRVVQRSTRLVDPTTEQQQSRWNESSPSWSCYLRHSDLSMLIVASCVCIFVFSYSLLVVLILLFAFVFREQVRVRSVLVIQLSTDNNVERRNVDNFNPLEDRLLFFYLQGFFFHLRRCVYVL